MKKYVIKILLWFAVIACCDILFGYVMSRLIDGTKGGATYKEAYIADHSDDELLIFGSSRAVHHYDPRIFQDSLSVSCYNCGFDGMGIIRHYCNLLMLVERYTPQYIIYDVSADFDFLEGDNHKFFAGLRPYFFRECVKDVLCAVDCKERLKCLSSFYRYNGLTIQVIQDYMIERYSGIRGFLPESKTMLKEAEVVEYEDDPEEHLDSLKLSYLNKFIDVCHEKDIELVFCISPLYKRRDIKEFAPIIDLARQRGVCLLNFGLVEPLCGDRSLFYDGVHMNCDGARVFSEIVASELKYIWEEF